MNDSPVDCQNRRNALSADEASPFWCTNGKLPLQKSGGDSENPNLITRWWGSDLYLLKKRDLSLFFDFYTDYKLELQFACELRFCEQ